VINATSAINKAISLRTVDIVRDQDKEEILEVYILINIFKQITILEEESTLVQVHQVEAIVEREAMIDKKIEIIGEEIVEIEIIEDLLIEEDNTETTEDD
jgi:hypothetical protein